MRVRKRTEKRQLDAKRRKNFLPTIIVTILFWLVIGYLLYFIDPENFGAVPVLFTLIFFALLFTFSIILANTRRGLLTSLGLTIFLILRYFGVGNILNLALLAGVVLAVEIYFTKTRG